jgi:hypothetical protein
LNLIKRTIDSDKCNILQFREQQYALIPELVRLCFKYLKTHGFEYDEEMYNEEVIDDIAYMSKHHFATIIIKVKVNTNPKVMPFLEIVIPKLIEGQFYRLNGTLYIPQFYIADEPITLKKNSISLYSLFNPITIYGAENRIILLGNNVPISRFLKLFYTNDEIKALDFPFEINSSNESIEAVLKNFSNVLGIPPVKEDIVKKLNDLFFDDWTAELYQEYYGINPDLKSILEKICSMDSDEISFIDIKHKRLIFIEYLLSPLFKAVTAATKRLVTENHNPKLLQIRLGDIVKHFFNDLKKANRYDSVNGFSGIINLKGNFKNPKGGNELPSEVSNVHPSFKGKIDPITVSNTNPGESITLVPEQNLKSLKFGIFDV